jgi:AcrR family transcriptional regulator
MARPRLISDAALLEIARSEFLVHGSRASTATIAAHAGVSEAVLFKRFGSKDALLRASMHETLACEFADAFPARLSKAGLALLGEGLFRHFERVVPMVLMSWAHLGGSDKPEGLKGSDPAPLRGVRLFENYFREQMKSGHLRKVNPAVLAHAFTGALWHFSFMRAALDASVAPKMSPKLFVRDLADMIWLGVSPLESRESV